MDTSDPSSCSRPAQALLFHGAGSSGTTAERLLGALLSRAWDRSLHLTCPEDRTGDLQTLGRIGRRFLADASGGPAAIGGISLGAHAAMSALAQTPPAQWPDVAIIAMPAWLGPPDSTAAITLSTGREIETSGVARTLHRIEAETPTTLRWIPTTLAADWAQYEPSVLASALITAAHQPAPSVEDLRTVGVPTFVIAVTGDALHPADIAHAWAEALPHSDVVDIELTDLGEGGFAQPHVIDRLRGFLATLG